MKLMWVSVCIVIIPLLVPGLSQLLFVSIGIIAAFIIAHFIQQMVQASQAEEHSESTRF